MYQLHNLADKVNGNKMLFSYIKLNKMMAVAKTSYKFGITQLFIYQIKDYIFASLKLVS